MVFHCTAAALCIAQKCSVNSSSLPGCNVTGTGSVLTFSDSNDLSSSVISRLEGDSTFSPGNVSLASTCSVLYKSNSPAKLDRPFGNESLVNPHTPRFRSSPFFLLINRRLTLGKCPSQMVRKYLCFMHCGLKLHNPCELMPYGHCSHQIQLCSQMPTHYSFQYSHGSNRSWSRSAYSRMLSKEKLTAISYSCKAT